ncbi:MAG: carbohydrate binding domain-containing protein, partial [Bacteroidota bacterium]
MKTKIFTHLVLGILMVAFQRIQAQNILTDGDFSTTSAIGSYYFGYPPPNVWCTWQSSDVIANATVVDGVCNYQVYSSGSYTSDVQLVQAGFPLTLGHSYRLSFDVKADAARTFGVFLGENEGAWTSIIGYDRYIQYATSEWKTIEINFSASCVFAYHKLSFELGTLNINTYFDNISLIDNGPYPLTIGIIGTSLSGWDTDIDMVTSDEVHYTLSNYPLTSGFVKFRQDNSWCVNWGNSTFPSGIGYPYGPDIPVPVYGNYDISFNRLTGEYSFTCVSNCPAAIGILGTAVPPFFDWNTDVNMSTNDGIIYTLANYDFLAGEAKFRQDDSWDKNWGNSAFPGGTAVLNGSNIPVPAGTYNVTFNLSTGEYKFEIPGIGILGTALNGWNEDVDLQTSDGINYTLLNYAFTEGYVKFRQDNNWNINWGNVLFPIGYGYPNGPNIPVMAGTYDVFFNRLTGEYNFSATSCPIAGIQCPGDIYLGSSYESCGAYAYYEPVVAAANCGGSGVSITQTSGLASGSFFPVG